MTHLGEIEALSTGFARLPAGFLLRGKPHPDPIPAAAPGSGADTTLASLTTLLYNEVYSRATEATSSALSVRAPILTEGKTTFLDELSRHNLTEELVDPGWRVQAMPSAGIVSATRNGATRSLAPGQYRADGEVQVGQIVTRIVAKEARQLQPGFYYAYGETEFEYSPTILRFYWNLQAPGAPILLQAATRLLNRYRVPFLFKCLDDPRAYLRRDAAVLFVKRQYLHVCREVLPQLHAAASAWLRDEVPFLTLRLAPGLGFAENPPGITSFGVHRMQLLAGGLLRAPDSATAPIERVAEVTRQFAAHGIDVAHPFLNPGSDPDYAQSLLFSVTGAAA